MKNYLVPVLLLLLSAAAQFGIAAPTLFDIQINNNTEPFLAFYVQKQRDADLVYSRIPLPTDGHTISEIEVPFDQIINFTYGKLSFPVSVRSGAECGIQFDGNNLYKSLTFTGDTAADNNFTAEYNRTYGKPDAVQFSLAHLPFTVAPTVAKQASTHTEEQFFRHRDEQKAAAELFLDRYRGTVSPDIFARVEKAVEYDDLSNRIAYLVVNKNRLTLPEILGVKDRHPLPPVDFKNEELPDYPAFQNYLQARMHYEFLPGAYGDVRQNAPIIYDLAQTAFSGRASWYLQAEILCRYLDKTGSAFFGQDRFPAFYKNNPYPAYTDKVQKVYGNALTGVASTPAPLLEAVTADGRPVALQDYQGKVVYISFWASWCKPCLSNFRKYKDLRRELQAMGVVLYNVSIDDTKEAFLRSLDRQPILGVNALAADTDKTKIEYNLSTIPAYYVIDKTGRFAFLSNEPGRDIKAEFRKLVNR